MSTSTLGSQKPLSEGSLESESSQKLLFYLLEKMDKLVDRAINGKSPKSESLLFSMKRILLLAIFSFSFQCDDPLGSLLDDTSMRASVDELLVYEGELASISFRLNASLFSDGKSATLTANLRCKGLSKSAQASRVTMDKNTITWTNSDWTAWKTFVFDAPDNQTQEPSTNCELVLDPLESNDVGFHGFNKIKPIPVIVLDNDGDVNIKVSPRSLVLPEGGSVSYTIHLTNRPRNQVEVNILHKNDFPEWFLVSSKPTIAVGGASVSSLTFTTENHNRPQTVTITYPEDIYANGNFLCTLKHTLTTDDPVYQNVSEVNFPEVVLTLSDNDTLNFQPVNNNGASISSLTGREGETTSFQIKPSVTLHSGSTITLDVTPLNTDHIQLADSSQNYSTSPVRLTFTDSNPVIVNVKFIDDLVETTADLLATKIVYSVVTDGADAPVINGELFSPNGGFAEAGGTLDIMIIDNIVDADGDGLIEIWNATMLDNMRYDLAGTSYKASAMDAGSGAGCPAGGCNGYELMANIDLLGLLDANTNGQIDKTTVIVANQVHTVIDVSEDTSWSPVGDNPTGDDASRFTGTFEGNGNTIANLWVNIPGGYAGLFGATGGSAEMRNVGVISGGVFSSSSIFSSSGGLVGSSSSSLTITNSYFSGSGGVSSSSDTDTDAYSGGLVGSSSSSLTITNSYFSGIGGVSSSASSSASSVSFSYSGGLVGFSSSLMITNSYFSGSGGVSSSSLISYSGGLVGRVSSSSFSLRITNSYFSGSGGVSSSSSSSSFSGGLVGHVSSSSLMITNSYFSGSDGVSASSSISYSGGLVGRVSSSSLMITNSYWNTDAPQLVDGSPQNPKRAQGDATADLMGAVGLTLAELQATSGTYPNLLGVGWDLGTDQQLPAVKRCILDTTMTGCASPVMYGDLLDGQRVSN